ncbi:MAG TPA: hypothetical protein VGI15_02420 [Candidatus Cybelea sp.]|jgi:hypothetical protein
MAPDAKKSDLVYISNFYGSDILVFTYPGGKYVGLISGKFADPQGLCAAASGNWWVVASGSDEVLEFAHGGTTPLKTLNVSGGEPAGCTVDPTSGNLAVTILGTSGVVVFTSGSGSGTTISDNLSATYSAAYDDKGDLFADGFAGSTPSLVELHKGHSKFVSITVSPSLEYPGALQWYGNYLALSGAPAGIGHFAIHGRKAKEVGVTQIADIGGFWIQKPDVAVTDPGAENAAIYKYPSGGSPIKVLNGPFDLPIGVTVSVAK